MKDRVISSFLQWVKELPYRHDVRVSDAGFWNGWCAHFDPEKEEISIFTEWSGISATKRMLEGVVHETIKGEYDDKENLISK